MRSLFELLRALVGQQRAIGQRLELALLSLGLLECCFLVTQLGPTLQQLRFMLWLWQLSRATGVADEAAGCRLADGRPAVTEEGGNGIACLPKLLLYCPERRLRHGHRPSV